MDTSAGTLVANPVESSNAAVEADDHREPLIIGHLSLGRARLFIGEIRLALVRPNSATSAAKPLTCVLSLE